MLVCAAVAVWLATGGSGLTARAGTETMLKADRDDGEPDVMAEVVDGLVVLMVVMVRFAREHHSVL